MRTILVRIAISIVLLCGIFSNASKSSQENDEDSCSSMWNTSEGAVAAANGYVDSFDSFTLTYFDGRGLAEIPRTLFATTGRAFEDVRLSREEFVALKDTGDLAKNLNRVPVLNHNGFVLGQSGAISRYLARRLDLFGRDEREAAEIESMLGHVEDVKTAYRKLFPYGVTLEESVKRVNRETWFDTPAAPALEGRKERQLRWFLGNVERILPGDGYAVGGRPSLADAYWYNLLGEHVPPEQGLGEKGEGWFQDRASTDRVLTMYPKLAAVVKTFGTSPGMVNWLATRGKQGF